MSIEALPDDIPPDVRMDYVLSRKFGRQPEELRVVGSLVLVANNESHGPDWRESALCAQTDPDIFFPEKGDSTRHAREVCAACTVRTPCLQQAIENGEEYGIWGGKGMKQINRRRKSS